MKPYPWTRKEVAILKSCAATDEGRAALSLIVQQLCDLTGNSFSRDPADMAFIAGRRWVAIQINDAVSSPIDQLVQEPHEPRTGSLTATERAERIAAGEPASPKRR